jgi:Tol biopolymer transport system component/tRNA A-37 threonylcarbamoyl transferase component Bud32
MAERLASVQRAFSAYLIERELGSGGMATVYLAHDKKHDRKVAIKILHAELAAVLGAERFLQEIRVTANLQHPHILGLIDSGVIGDDGGELRGRPYYVMPFVEGESLRQRLDKEQQLPISDSVRIATEVASALDYAHRHNVIHRDIKPENILLHDGSAIVADFGIALAVTEAGGARMTQTGLSLGTPSYMSPEQAMGERAITARSDIYSLGAVTYEMLSGEPPFTGPTVQAVVARVMTEEPRPLITQRRNVPPNVAAAVSHALEKIPADRFASAHEFAEALNNPSFALSTSSATLGPGADTRRFKKMFYGAAVLAALFLVIATWGWMRPTPPKPVVMYRLALDSTEAMAEGGSYWSRLTLSPDGMRLAYLGGPHGQILIRERNQLHAVAIPGTEGANSPFFSPDGQHIGFVTGGRNLQIVALNGGSPVTVTDSMVGVAGASWGPDGFIYADGLGSVSLVRVEAKAGAVPKWFTALDTARGEVDHLWPDVLPNRRGVLFTAISYGKGASKNKQSFDIAVADIPSGKHRVIVNDARYARYSASGHLLYVTSNRTLMVAPFDQNSMKVTGEATALIEGIRMGAAGVADLALSEGGRLVYATSSQAGEEQLVWVTREGKAQPVDPDWQGDHFFYPELSPDGKRVAVTKGPLAPTADIWIKQLDKGPVTRLTLEGRSYYPDWTPDGQSVTFSGNTSGTYKLWTRRADGSAQAVSQLQQKWDLYEPRWSRDGKWLVFVTERQKSDFDDIMGIRPGTDTVPVALVSTKFEEGAPAISPDGRWLAYTSNESGAYEVFVVPFPNTGATKWAVSSHGGTEARWSHSGRELFYRDGAKNLVAVAITTNPTFSVGRSTTLFAAGGFSSDELSVQYAVAPDDRRFLMIRPLVASGPDKLIVVENWFEELKAKSRK